MSALASREAGMQGQALTPYLRRGTPADAQRAGEIGFAAFKTIAERHGFAPDFPTVEDAVALAASMLARPDVYSVVAESAGSVVGSAFLWESAPIAAVGPITVQPGTQDAQVGRRLMIDVLERAERRGLVGVRLVQAAYHGRSLALYTKLGFVAREPLSCLQGPALGVSIPGCSVRAALERDIAAANALCRRVHGLDRMEELAYAVAQGAASVVERGGRITAYATTLGFFGHAVAETNDDLKALIGAARAFAGPGFLLPTRNGDVLRWCLERGLRIVQPMTLMSTGLYNEPAGTYLPSVLF